MKNPTKTIASTIVAMGLMVSSASACGITECQPHGGITHPEIEKAIAEREGWTYTPVAGSPEPAPGRSPEKPENPPIQPQPVPSTPEPPKPSDLPPVASEGNLEEDTPPSVGIIPPWVFEPTPPTPAAPMPVPPGFVPVGGGETFIPIPEIKLPKAGS